LKPEGFFFVELAEEGKSILVQDENRQSRQTEALSPRRSPRRGRPTLDDGAALESQILEMALDRFLEQGFDQTTVEAIARPLRMTKRTIYVRYGSKASLFKAAASQAIERWVMPMDELRTLPEDNLEQLLRRVAEMRVAHQLSPHGTRVRRILREESSRFPELVEHAYKRITLPLVEFIGAVLARHHERGEVIVERPKLAASIFLAMVAGGASHKVSTVGVVPITPEIDDRMNYGLKLFLEGIRRKDRPRAEPGNEAPEPS